MMRVRCIANTGRDLPQLARDASGSVNSQFPVHIGEIYTVYGVHLWKRTVGYLIDLSGNPPQQLSFPNWNPADLFEIVDSQIPVGWHFDFRGYMEGYWLNAILGYPELLDEGHYRSLIEADTPEDRETAIRIFLQRKKEVDELYGSVDDCGPV